MLTDLFLAESKSQVYAALHQLLRNHLSDFSKLSKHEFDASLLFFIYIYFVYCQNSLCYDDGCHLRRYARNPIRNQHSQSSQKLANAEIVVDKMHMAGHVDEWCRQNCDPRAFKELVGVRINLIVVKVCH